MIKYTLFCRNGNQFQENEHYCYFGSWLSGTDRYTVLRHGSISEKYYEEIKARGEVLIFYDWNIKCWSIEELYCGGYYKRVKDYRQLIKYVGTLVKTNKSRLYKEGLKREN